MNVDQLEQAKKRATELLKYQQETEELREFIKQTEENKSLYLRTSHQKEMWANGGSTFALIGEEVLRLLKNKMWEREEYIEKLGADDLVNPHGKDEYKKMLINAQNGMEPNKIYILHDIGHTELSPEEAKEQLEGEVLPSNMKKIIEGEKK